MYKLAKEDDKTYHVQHPDGSTFQVAKSAIPKRLHDQIKALPMADGGQVKKDDVPEPNKKNAKEMQQGATSGGPTLSQAWSNLKSGIQGYYDGGKFGDPEEEKPVTEEPVKAPYNVGDTIVSPLLQQATSSPGVPALAEVGGTPATSPPGQITPGPLPVAGPPTMEQSLLGSSAALPGGAMGKGFEDTAQSIVTRTKANMGQAQEEQKNQADLTNKLAAAHVDAVNRTTTAQADYDQTYKDIGDGKIHPNNVWATGDIGNKIAAGLSIALGSIGGAMTGKGGNVALDIINKSIDQDIDIQKQNLATKHGLLAENIRRLGDARQGELYTRMQLTAASAAKTAEIAAKYGTPQALAAAQAQIGALNQQGYLYAQQQAMLGAQNQLYNPNSNGFTSETLPAHIRQQLGGKLVEINGKPWVAKNEKMGDELNKAQAEIDPIDKGVQALNHLMATPNSLEKFEEAKAHIADLSRRIAHYSGDRFTDTQKEAIQAELSNPGDILNRLVTRKPIASMKLMEGLKQELESKRENYLHGYKSAGASPAMSGEKLPKNK